MRYLEAFAAFIGIVAMNHQLFAQTIGPVKNIIVCNEPGQFAGWPANNGIWIFENEIVVGFHYGKHKDKDGGHPIDPDVPQVPRFARSINGGESWTLEVPTYLQANGQEKRPQPCPGNIDFTQPQFAMMMRMTSSDAGFSHFYWSNDRCHTWSGPYELPEFGRKGIFARTDILINGKHDLLACLTAAKEDGHEGWPFVAQTRDGAKTWEFVSWIGAEPGIGEYAIMPTTVRLSPTELYTYIRCRGREAGKKTFRIEPYRSLDNGRSWQLESANSIDNSGNPAHLVPLKDGRLALTYGTRHKPYGIRARISDDQGRTWTSDIILRDDGNNWDVGYVRTVQRPDNKLVTAYYFNDSTQKERYIAATIWNPGQR